MAAYNIKHIEYLRQKANLTYEEAVALLDRNDGDITQALVELERRGALRSEPAGHLYGSTDSHADGKARGFWDNAVDLFIKMLRIKLVVEKDREVIVRLPVLYLIAALFISIHLALLSVILMFLTGCKVHLERDRNPEGDRKIRDYAKGAEQKVRSTVSDAMDRDRQRNAPYNAPHSTPSGSAAKSAPKQNDHDDFDTFTVE